MFSPLHAPEERPAGSPPGDDAFQAHVGLLEFFLSRRGEIVERIQGILNAQRKPADYLQDSPLLSRLFEDCFFTLPGAADARRRLRGQLQEAHWAAGFRPRVIAGLHNDLADPAEMMTRAFHVWQQTRWPGRNGRVRYAHALFNLYMIWCLQLLSLRVWDPPSGAGSRLSRLQDLLDRLWAHTPADQPVLVRDAHWLIPMAQSPATDDLGAYFDVAATVADTLPDSDRLAVHAAGVRMAAGHLRSQIRYHATKTSRPLDDAGLLLHTRSSNALDFALLIQELVPLLEAYERSSDAGDDAQRLQLADAICQGVSPDPELFLNRVRLLGAYSMLEELFITTDRDGRAAYTPMGQRHVRLIEEYEARIGRVAARLAEDSARFRPIANTYSPYGVLYGFTSNLIEHMTFKTLQPDAETRFSLEDVFAGGGADRREWVIGWRRLPHLSREVEQLFEYPHQFAEAIFERVERALHKRVADDAAMSADRDGRLFVLPRDGEPADSAPPPAPDLPVRYIRSSDAAVVAAQKAEACPEWQLLGDRREGKFVLSYKTPGGWVALTKAILTEVVGAGRDAAIRGLSPEAAGALKLLCRDLAVVPERNDLGLVIRDL